VHVVPEANSELFIKLSPNNKDIAFPYTLKFLDGANRQYALYLEDKVLFVPLNITLSPALIVVKSMPLLTVKSVQVVPLFVEYDNDIFGALPFFTILIVLESSNDSMVK
jgi:hypothetical protein